MRRLILTTAMILVSLTSLAAAPARAASPFANWAAIIVAGDNHAHDGTVSDVFDNGRRDLTAALVGAGFSADNVLQFSIQPEKFKDPKPFPSLPVSGIYQRLSQLTQRATGGCLVYFTSHGSPEGILMGDGILPPANMAQIIDDNCGKRPTVAVISACFSGVFVPALAWPNRLVMTAARPDRTSFGCGNTDQYTYFDQCFIQSLKTSASLKDLAEATPACVSRREVEMKMEPPSEPQVSAGAQIRMALPLYTLTKPSG